VAGDIQAVCAAVQEIADPRAESGTELRRVPTNGGDRVTAEAELQRKTSYGGKRVRAGTESLRKQRRKWTRRRAASPPGAFRIRNAVTRFPVSLGPRRITIPL
jgi:hypothetical protein